MKIKAQNNMPKNDEDILASLLFNNQVRNEINFLAYFSI